MQATDDSELSADGKPNRLARLGELFLRLPVIVGLALTLTVGSFNIGFFADDHVHQMVLSGSEADTPMSRWSLYEFGSAEQWSHYDRNSALPWWISDDWNVRFFRPLTSAYLVGLHSLFGNRPTGYHCASLALFAILILVVHSCFKALGLEPRTARIGTLIFALCDSAALPVSWTANVNSLLAALCAVSSLRFLLSKQLGTAAILASLALACMAALCNEAGTMTLLLVGVGCWHRSRALSDPKQKGRARMGAVCALVLMGTHLGFLLLEGYGTRSLFYATPWSSPLAFASNLVVLFSAGCLSLLGPMPLDMLLPFPAARLPLIIAGFAIGMPLMVMVWRTARRCAPNFASPFNPATALLCWSVAYALLPAGAPPADRLLFLPAVGVAGLLAIFFEKRRRAPSATKAGRGLVRALFFSVTIGSGLFLFLQVAGLGVNAEYLRTTAAAMQAGAPQSGKRDAIVLQSESQLAAFTLSLTYLAETGDRDLTIRQLQIGRRSLQLTRSAPRSFDLESLDSPFLTNAFERLYLTEAFEAEVGLRWSNDLFEVEILALDGAWPSRLRFHWQTDLDSPNQFFLVPVQGRLAPIALPQVGESILLEAPTRHGPYMP